MDFSRGRRGQLLADDDAPHSVLHMSASLVNFVDYWVGELNANGQPLTWHAMTQYLKRAQT